MNLSTTMQWLFVILQGHGNFTVKGLKSFRSKGNDHIPFPDYGKGSLSGREGGHGLCCHKVGMVESNGNIQHIMKKCDMKYALHSSLLLQ